ncbi:hypothetical protein SGRA_3407 [Saprospira grandis str. Lewin]|uniref:PD-(D/E)XK nuclease superfamily protein n=1 Tax=Saprospira grandis (strain Lewin) TaxID=984262 RepID=H6L1Q4_SAPGL|nr:hypothetical protein SGRA_3407 [Saprospira grandis str. Lewin]
MGENFNIFETLKLHKKEVRLHSSILAEFLNPSGTHGQEDKFLRLFLEQESIQNFDSKSAIVEVEKFAGFLNDDKTEGGRIDIVITDADNKRIIIENKIYAEDQKNQLLRYHNFDPTARLYYLNLFGEDPTDRSLDSENYKIISYKHDIILWLESCRKEAVALPIIRETIAQYINLLKRLTNQTSITTMKDDIKELIIKNPEYAEAIDLSYHTLQTLIKESETSFKTRFTEQFNRKNNKYQLKNGCHIKVYWDEDEDGLYIGYSLYEGDRNVSNSALGLRYQDIMKESEIKFNPNEHHIGWFTPKGFKSGEKYENLDIKKILELGSDVDLLDSFVQELIAQEKRATEAFLDKIKEDLVD